MAHALRRISYATCDPDCCQFAFLAREPRAQPNVQYCHAFVTKTSEEVRSLRLILFHNKCARKSFIKNAKLDFENSLPFRF